MFLQGDEATYRINHHLGAKKRRKKGGAELNKAVETKTKGHCRG